MRTTFIAALLSIATATTAYAQIAEPTRSLRSAKGRGVAVIDLDSREWQGRLLEIGKDSIVVEIDSAARRFTLADVKRIDAHGDRVYDGAVKGALFGAAIGGLTFGGRGVLSASLVYGLIGLGLDAANNCHHTVFRAPPIDARKQLSMSISW